MFKLVACDIDGTILPHGERTLSKKIINMFKELQSNNIITAFSTGREFITIGDMINTPYVDYFVGANGTFVYDMNKKVVIYEKAVKYEDYTKLHEFCDQNEIPISVITNDSVYFKNKESYRNNWFWGQFYELMKPLDSPLLKNDRIHQITIRTEEGAKREEIIEFVKNTKGLRINAIWPNGMFVAAPGVSKASGLAEIGKVLNIDLSEMVAFGDGENDLEMIAEVGMGVAMANGVPQAKKLAKKIADSDINDGVIKVLKELKLIQ